MAVVGLMLVIAFSVIGLYGKNPPKNQRVQIAATIFPIYDLVRTIGGEKVDARLLLPGDESPVALPNIYNGIDLSRTQIVFAVGLGYDTVGIPSEYASKVTTLDSGIDLLLEQGSAGSPYYWLSVKNAEQMARTIAERLSQVDPASSEYYASNLKQTVAHLDSLDHQITQLLSQVPRKKMVVYGYDWGYFAKEYGLEVVDFEPAGAISASRVEELRKKASDFGLTALFTDIRLSPGAFLPAMAKQYLTLFHLDIFGGVENRTSYAATMEYNAKSIYEGLTGAP